MPSLHRRTLLGAVAAGSLAALAGCSSSCPDSSTPDPETVVRAGENSGGGFESAPDGAWPAPRYDAANTGFAPGGTPPEANPSGGTGSGSELAVRWRRDVPAPEPEDVFTRTSSPVVADGLLVATTAAGVRALDLRDGTDAWEYEGVVPATTGPTFGYDDEFAPPVVDGGTVYAGGREALVAVDLADGTEQWRYAGEGSFGAPTVADGTVYAPTSGGVAAVGADDGSELWTAGGAPRSLLAVADGTVVVSGDRTVALEAATGERRWSDDRAAEHYPVVADGLVYLGTYGGLHALGLDDGDHRWTFERGGGRSLWAPVVAPDTIYTVEQPGEAGAATFALDRTDGEPTPRWCSYLGEGAVTAAAGGRAFALKSPSGPEPAPVQLLAFADRLGDAVWGYAARERLLPPAVLDGAVVALDRSGTAVALGGA